jgi:hypothetical protein
MQSVGHKIHIFFANVTKAIFANTIFNPICLQPNKHGTQPETIFFSSKSIQTRNLDMVVLQFGNYPFIFLELISLC